MLAVLLAASVAVEGTAPGAKQVLATRVMVEVFSVALAADDGLLYSRREVELRDGANPDARARAEAQGDLALIHSTSWRWESDGRIVLTYLAWAKDGSLAGARRLPKLSSPGPTDPLHPRPAQIRELDPLAHGLRHLSFLLRTDGDGAVAVALGPRGVVALSRLAPEVAGELPSQN